MPRSPHRHLSATSALGAALVVLALGLAACGSSDSSSGPKGVGSFATTTTRPSGPKPSLAHPCGRTTAPPKRYEHVVILMEENRTWNGGRTAPVGLGFDAAKMPFLHGLAEQCTYYEHWNETNADQNSLNQYIGLTSGIVNDKTVWDCSPSDTCKSTDPNLFRQIREDGGTPRSFVDGATEPCSAGTNAAKHIPALYYQGGKDASFCKDEVRPWSELDPDHLPTLAFLSPDLCHDGHDCSDEKVDAFAKETLAPILDGDSYREGKTLVVVVYDEDAPVPNLLVAPTAHAGMLSTPEGSHASLLKTIEQLLGLPVLQQGQLPEATSLRASAHL